MPILRRLRTLDWPTLLAELVLIFVGITAALWFENVNQERAERGVEQEVLSQLVVALQSDTADLNSNLRSGARTSAAIDSILVYLDEKRPYHESLADHFGRSSIHTNFFLNAAAYEFLKAVGFDIIQNDDLRRGITQYYEVEVGYLTGVEQTLVNENWNGGMRPRMTRSFSYHFLYGPAVPHDYAALSEDPEYRSLLTTTRALLRFKDSRTRVVLEHAEELLRRIGAELASG